MTVKKRNGRWCIDIQLKLPGQDKPTRIRKVSPVNKKAAALKYEEKVREQLLDEALGKRVKRCPTLEEFSTEFLDYQRASTRPGSVRSCEGAFRRHILPELGSLRLDEIGTREIDRFRVRLGKHLAPRTVNLQLAYLRRALSLAKKWDVIPAVPEISRNKVPDSAKIDFLNFKESELLLKESEKRGRFWHTWLILGIRAGLRIGESLGMRWGDLDFINDKVLVYRSWDPDHGFGPTKSGKSREVPMSWDLKEALEKHREFLRLKFGEDACGPEDLVFPRRALDSSYGESGPVRRQSCLRFLERSASALGMRRVNPHMLRHTFASHAVMRGVPIRVLQAWLGHADLKQTMVYSHLSEGVHADFIDRIAAPRGLRVVEENEPDPGKAEEA